MPAKLPYTVGAKQIDGGKESKHILSRVAPAGPNCTILGFDFNTKLLMHDAVASCLVEAGWRISVLLRSKRYHIDVELVDSDLSQAMDK